MTEDKFRITLHMVSSADGIIAKEDNSVSWFESSDHYEKGVADLDPEDIVNSIDCYVMGSRTYEHALELSESHGWPYGDVPTIVVSGRDLPAERKSVEIYSGDLTRLVKEHLKTKYKNVWVVGGSALFKEFIRLKLADEIRQIVMPVILGSGKLFYDHIGLEQELHLKDITAYRNGMVELWYEIRKTDA